MARVEIEIEDLTLWDGVFGSGATTFSWWWDVENKGDYKARITAESPNGTAFVRLVTVNALGRALSKALAEGYVDACTGNPIPVDPTEWDACVGDVVLQLAVFDEVVYG